MVEVARHRTALSRTELSRPIRLALHDGLIGPGATIMDYGCGLGGDVARLCERGFDCVGWDPNHHPKGERRHSDFVNLSYVVNVIESAAERSEVLRSAWALARTVLVVAARLKTELGGAAEPGTAFEDGRLTRLKTFQKFYDQQELRSWIEATLSVAAVAAAPGIFYVFRRPETREAFVAGQIRRHVVIPRLTMRETLLAQHRSLFEALGAFLAARGRLPGPDELAEYAEILNVAGSLARAFRLLESASDVGAWAVVRDLRKQDLLIYLALARFNHRPRFGDLPTDIQRDVKAFCGSYAEALQEADSLLFSLGTSGTIDASARASAVGKLMPTALYIHESARPELPAPLRLLEGCARTYYGVIPGANVIKINLTEPKVTYLSYPQFETDPHPSLAWSVSVHLQTFRVKQRMFDPDGNVPILHRKELLVSSSHPLRSKFSRLTQSEERWGLYADPSRIGLRVGWTEVLRAQGVELRGHRVVRSSPRPRD